MSWVLVAFFLVGVLLIICVGVWWGGFSGYFVMCSKASGGRSRLFTWGKSLK
uniref:ATP synthase F0 subunit 8 n=1 Tax=Lamprotula leaii TaxID=1903488 RepID=A0A0C4G601_9BIVA|nr:ATP synthase F0 subunit 8 [Lamprotula leaii]